MMTATRDSVEVGGPISYGPNFPELWRRAGDYVDKVLRGTKPADLPVEQPTRFDLIINLTTAKALGLEIPPTLLARADGRSCEPTPERSATIRNPIVRAHNSHSRAVIAALVTLPSPESRRPRVRRR